MSEKRSKTGLLSRLTAPIAKAAQKVARRMGEGGEDEELRRLADMGVDTASAAAPLTDDAFRMTMEQMLTEDDGAFQIKLHVISLVEFREAVGDRWVRVADKVMMIAEGVINLHLGAGNVFGRQGTDFFVLLFRTVDNDEARRRALTIVQELGTRLVGDQFLGDERPLALAAELPLEDGLNADASVNLDAVNAAVGEIRSLIAGRKEAAAAPPAWMRSGSADGDDNGLRAHLKPSAAAPPKVEVDTRPPVAITGEAARAPAADPKWKPLEVSGKGSGKPPAWVVMEHGERKAPVIEELPDPGPPPLPPDAKLALIWRPTWVAAGELIGAYKARIQRIDTEGATAIEGVKAYPLANEAAANTLDRFCIANAVRDFHASERVGNNSTVVIPIHWSTLAAENRMEILAPFANLTQQARGSRVVIEVFGVPADVKPIILGTVIQGAHNLCRHVCLRTRLSDPRAALAADCGASMIGVDLSELASPERTDDDTLLEALNAFLAQAGKARMGAYVWGVRRRKVIVGAVQSGFAMVNGPALMKDIPKPAKTLPAPKARFALP